MTADDTNNPANADREWWTKPFSVFQTNLQEIDVTMDVNAAPDMIKGYGADTSLFNVGGIVLFYPSEFAFQTRNLLLSDRPSGELIEDAVSAAKRRGISHGTDFTPRHRSF